jgi:hypothetical protein
MQLVPNPNSWSCLLASFASALDVNINVLIDEVGHDGSEIVFPEAIGINKYRAYHPQEFIPSAMRRGYAVTHIAREMFTHRLDRGEELIYRAPDVFKLSDYMVLDGRYVLMTHNHAMSSDGVNVYDPAAGGRIHLIHNAFQIFKFQHLLILQQISC